MPHKISLYEEAYTIIHYTICKSGERTGETHWDNDEAQVWSAWWYHADMWQTTAEELKQINK